MWSFFQAPVANEAQLSIGIKIWYKDTGAFIQLHWKETTTTIGKKGTRGFEQFESLEEAGNIGSAAFVPRHASHVAAGLDVCSASVIGHTLCEEEDQRCVLKEGLLLAYFSCEVQGFLLIFTRADVVQAHHNGFVALNVKRGTSNGMEKRVILLEILRHPFHLHHRQKALFLCTRERVCVCVCERESTLITPDFKASWM